MCEVLDELGYLDGDTVTPDGQRLQRLYSELDLLAGECLRRGTWDALEPAELAAVLSGLTYESRSPEGDGPPRFPHGSAAIVGDEMSRIWAELEEVERSHRLSFLRRPDFGFAWTAWQWASGYDLDEVLESNDIAAGDFVRSVKQLLDVIEQVAAAATDKGLRSKARAAADLLRRGVVSYTSVSE